MAQRKTYWKIWLFFWILFVLMIFVGFIMDSFQSYYYIQTVLSGIVLVLLFFSMVYSLSYNEKAAKILVAGFICLILVGSIWFLSSIFSEYFFLKLHPVVLMVHIVGIFTVLYGFREAMR